MKLATPIVGLMLGLLFITMGWGVILDVHKSYTIPGVENYIQPFSNLTTQMDNTVKFSDNLRGDLKNETLWSVTDTIIFTGSMVWMVLSFLGSVIPLTFSTLTILFEMLNLPGEIAWIFAISMGIVVIIIAIKILAFLMGRDE